MKICGKLSRPKLPPWIKVKVGVGEREAVADTLADLRLNTVCSGAMCPNLGECFCRGTATFLIMGSSCTRNCKFCAIDHNQKPLPVETDEPARVAEAVRRLKLKYAVITSVTRDDLPDGGARYFAETIRLIKALPTAVEVEVLTPDFNLDLDALRVVLADRPTVFNHNIETVRRLSGQIRYQATYDKSLALLRAAGEMAPDVPTKSGIMVGLGETDEEIIEAMRDLRDSGVSILTVGQYLPPSAEHWPLDRYVTPEMFKEFEEIARKLGFSAVASGPLVRSSYHAGELIKNKGV